MSKKTNISGHKTSKLRISNCAITGPPSDAWRLILKSERTSRSGKGKVFVNVISVLVLTVIHARAARRLIVTSKGTESYGDANRFFRTMIGDVSWLLSPGNYDKHLPPDIGALLAVPETDIAGAARKWFPPMLDPLGISKHPECQYVVGGGGEWTGCVQELRFIEQTYQMLGGERPLARFACPQNGKFSACTRFRTSSGQVETERSY
jgi:hypothetical protein